MDMITKADYKQVICVGGLAGIEPSLAVGAVAVAAAGTGGRIGAP